MSLCCKRNTCERFPLTITTVHNEYIATQKLRVFYRIYAKMANKYALKRSLFKVLEPSRVRVGVKSSICENITILGVGVLTKMPVATLFIRQCIMICVNPFVWCVVTYIWLKKINFYLYFFSFVRIVQNGVGWYKFVKNLLLRQLTNRIHSFAVLNKFEQSQLLFFS